MKKKDYKIIAIIFMFLSFVFISYGYITLAKEIPYLKETNNINYWDIKISNFYVNDLKNTDIKEMSYDKHTVYLDLMMTENNSYGYFVVDFTNDGLINAELIDIQIENPNYYDISFDYIKPFYLNKGDTKSIKMKILPKKELNYSKNSNFKVIFTFIEN